MTACELWLDKVNAIEELADRAKGDASLYSFAEELIGRGFCILRKVICPSLIERVKVDYERWLTENNELAAQNQDRLGRQFRVTNFHVYSKAAIQIGHNAEVMRHLDFVFEKKTAIYTSLSFKYSTEQPLHRDSPYFHTFPYGNFLGVWIPLEDIHPDSGPLMYVPSSHWFEIDQRQLFAEALLAHNQNHEKALNSAFESYRKLILTTSEKIGNKQYAILDRGDVAIWHPELVHGGSPAFNKSLTRQSMVFHCVPEGCPVFTQETFFTYGEETAPPSRFSYTTVDGRSYASCGGPFFMSSI